MQRIKHFDYDSDVLHLLYFKVEPSTDRDALLDRLDVVNLPPSSSVARDLKSGYELLIGKNDDISSSNVVLFVAQKPKPEDIQMVKGLKGLGLKITIVALGNGFDMREWLNMEGTIPLPDGGKDGVDVIEIIDKIIDEANKGEFFSIKSS